MTAISNNRKSPAVSQPLNGDPGGIVQNAITHGGNIVAMPASIRVGVSAETPRAGLNSIQANRLTNVVNAASRKAIGSVGFVISSRCVRVFHRTIATTIRENQIAEATIRRSRAARDVVSGPGMASCLKQARQSNSEVEQPANCRKTPAGWEHGSVVIAEVMSAANFPHYFCSSNLLLRVSNNR